MRQILNPANTLIVRIMILFHDKTDRMALNYKGHLAYNTTKKSYDISSRRVYH